MPLGQPLAMGPFQFEIDKSTTEEGRIYVTTTGKERLFRVDLSNLGSAIESEIESHPISEEGGRSAVVKSPTKELLLLQKAEAFLLRRNVKARDAYDVRLLKALGAVLSPNLRAHMEDTILANEIDSESILDRIDAIHTKRCRLELKPILPPEVYSGLEEVEFEPLRSALKELYEQWL